MKLQDAIDRAKEQLAEGAPSKPRPFRPRLPSFGASSSVAAVEAIASPLRKAIGAAISGQLVGEQFLVGEAKQLLKSLRLLGCIKRSENVESIEALLRGRNNKPCGILWLAVGS